MYKIQLDNYTVLILEMADSADTVFSFGALLNNKKEFDEWLIEKGLVPRVSYCMECFEEMKNVAGKPLRIMKIVLSLSILFKKYSY